VSIKAKQKRVKKLRATQVFFTPKQGGCFTFFFSSKTKGSTIISGDSAKHTRFAIHQSAAAPF
jgi:hypothetical protein